MAAAAILDFWKCAFVTTGSKKLSQGYDVWSLTELLYSCGNYQHFSKSKMAAAAILDFGKVAFLISGINKVSASCRPMLFKFGENRFTLAETINISQIQDGGRRQLGFWKSCIFDPGDSIKVSSTCMLFTFDENRFTPTEAIKFFFKIQYGGFSKCLFSANFSICKLSCFAKFLKFGNDKSMHSKVGLIFWIFVLAWHSPIAGLFGAVFGDWRPKTEAQYNSNIHRAQQATEWLIYRSRHFP